MRAIAEPREQPARERGAAGAVAPGIAVGADLPRVLYRQARVPGGEETDPETAVLGADPAGRRRTVERGRLQGGQSLVPPPAEMAVALQSVLLRVAVLKNVPHAQQPRIAPALDQLEQPAIDPLRRLGNAAAADALGPARPEEELAAAGQLEALLPLLSDLRGRQKDFDPARRVKWPQAAPDLRPGLARGRNLPVQDRGERPQGVPWRQAQIGIGRHVAKTERAAPDGTPVGCSLRAIAGNRRLDGVPRQRGGLRRHRHGDGPPSVCRETAKVTETSGLVRRAIGHWCAGGELQLLAQLLDQGGDAAQALYGRAVFMA